MKGNSSYWSDFAAKCREELLGNVMPFWMKYGWDRKNGGVYTCLDRDGSLMDSTKSVWFQGRFGWMTAYAYNHVKGIRDRGSGIRREWLAASKSCCEFLEKHCFDRDGRAFFEVTAEGVGLRKRRYVFSECFAAMATQGHSLTMILINVANVLKQVSNDPVLDRLLAESKRKEVVQQEVVQMHELDQVECYERLEKAGFDQIPCGGNWREEVNLGETVKFCRECIAPERLLGFLVAPWRRLTPSFREVNLKGVDLMGEEISRWR